MAKIPLCVEGKRKGEGGGKGEWRKREGVRLGRKGGKEEIGIPGGVYLKESLTHCTDPLKAIEEFQVRGQIAS